MPEEKVEQVVKTETKWAYIKRVMSDGGEPSSTRWLMWTFAVFSMVFLGIMLGHMFKIKDQPSLGLWLAALPGVIIALAGLVGSPYGLNAIRQFAGSISGAFKKQDDGDSGSN